VILARAAWLALAAALALAACTGTPRRRATTPGRDDERGDVRYGGETERGKASWYGRRFQGRKTASGERFDRFEMTAAHKRLPFGTRVRVTWLARDRSVEVRINDRGPYGPGRIIDLSEEAARRLGMIEAGVVPVEVEVLSVPAKGGRRRR
jgi:rare lipoprotein A